jgi:hypothetical protein
MGEGGSNSDVVPKLETKLSKINVLLLFAHAKFPSNN